MRLAPGAERAPVVVVDLLRRRRDGALRVGDGLGERVGERAIGEMGQRGRQRLAGQPDRRRGGPPAWRASRRAG